MQCSAESVRSKVIAAVLLLPKKTCNDEGYIQYLVYVSDNNQQKYLCLELFIVQVYL